jgi:glucose/arabinose dehydrogenase
MILGSIMILVVLGLRSNVAAESNNQESVVLSLKLFSSGLNSPVSITNAGTGDGRLFVNEKAGVIKIVQADGTVVPKPFLDITGQVTSQGEEGFLGLAFHPQYAENGYFFVNYTNMTNNVRRTRISRFMVSGDANIADPESEDILLTITQPFSNHNAGDIHFGPDGYLYIPLGDGGGGGDSNNNAQNLKTLLGKVVRIDVDSLDGNQDADCRGGGSGNYRIPTMTPKNPFIDGPGGTCDEIWASGLRNPWRSSFDREIGDFYIGDVGQNAWEEINFQPVSSTGSENYGWRCYEGNHRFNISGCGAGNKYIFPIFEYSHVEGTDKCSGSVTGGYVYRGSKYPMLTGRYFLADFCQGTFWDLERTGDIWRPTEHMNLKEPGYSAFGEDSSGEIYLANMFNGNIYQLEGPPAGFDAAGFLPLVLK